MSGLSIQKRLLGMAVLGAAVILVSYIPLHAANWIALPPYNVLWPLWSPALSPIDSLTGLPVPFITHLNRDTILPVQPGLVWDPAQDQPFLLYNNPLVYFGGLMYFSQLFGFNSWPPPYMVSAETGFPLPIALPLDYAFLGPTDYNLLSDLIPLANGMFSTRYGIPLANLLTAEQIWGL
ncbi:MAG: hypothetical protein ACMUIS_03750 [bacterium]